MRRRGRRGEGFGRMGVGVVELVDMTFIGWDARSSPWDYTPQEHGVVGDKPGDDDEISGAFQESYIMTKASLSVYYGIFQHPVKNSIE